MKTLIALLLSINLAAGSIPKAKEPRKAFVEDHGEELWTWFPIDKQGWRIVVRVKKTGEVRVYEIDPSRIIL